MDNTSKITLKRAVHSSVGSLMPGRPYTAYKVSSDIWGVKQRTGVWIRVRNDNVLSVLDK